MIPWQSLFLLSDDQDSAHQHMEAALRAAGFQLYNPFGLMPGMAYPRTIRTFIAPPYGNWTRILIETTEPNDLDSVLHSLSHQTICIYAALQGAQAVIEVHAHSSQVEQPLEALAAHLRPGATPNDLARAWRGDVVLPQIGNPAGEVGAIPIDQLPPDVQAMASGLRGSSIQQMFSKLTDQLMGGANRQAASDLLKDTPDWNSTEGQRLRAVLSCLLPPDRWREPDFPTLRAAYPLYLRLERHPGATLYPGDEEAMQAIPDALNYVPVYGGQGA